jgi:hypothetical protein
MSLIKPWPVGAAKEGAAVLADAEFTSRALDPPFATLLAQPDTILFWDTSQSGQSSNSIRGKSCIS